MLIDVAQVTLTLLAGTVNQSPSAHVRLSVPLTAVFSML